MKFVKKINISSDGSLYFCYQSVTNPEIERIFLKTEDDKNFFFNKKKKVKQFDSKQFYSYKKKYFS